MTEYSNCSSYSCGGKVERWDTDRRIEGKFSSKTVSLVLVKLFMKEHIWFEKVHMVKAMMQFSFTIFSLWFCINAHVTMINIC